MVFRHRARRSATALVAAACVLVVAGCGSTTFVDTSPGQAAPSTRAGWQRVDPVAVKLPTRDPVAGSAPEPSGATPILVNIWASYCTPCKKELPLLERLSRGGRITVVGFTRDSHRDRADEALRAAGVTYPNWMDPDATLALELDGRVPINAVPSSFLIRDGKVVAIHIGPFKSAADVLRGLEVR